MQTITLTKEQQRFAEENYKLIFSFMQKYRLPHDEWYGIAAIGFCKAVIKYNPERETAFSSYAYKVMLNDVRMEMRKSKAPKRKAYVVSLQSELSDGFTLEETLAYEPRFMDSLILDEAKRHIGTMEIRKQLIISLLAEGKTQLEIAGRIGVSQSQVSRYIKALRKEIKNALSCEEGLVNGLQMRNKYIRN